MTIAATVSAVKRKFPGAVLCNEGGWYWVLLHKGDSCPGSFRDPHDAWREAHRKAKTMSPTSTRAPVK